MHNKNTNNKISDSCKAADTSSASNFDIGTHRFLEVVLASILNPYTNALYLKIKQWQKIMTAHLWKILEIF